MRAQMHTETHRCKQKHKHIQHTHRPTEILAHKNTFRHLCTQAHRDAYRHVYSLTHRHTGTYTHRPTDIQGHIQTYAQSWQGWPEWYHLLINQ